MNIGERIRAARTAAGLSQAELAELCGWGYNQGRVSHYETNTRKAGVEECVTICRALGISLDELIFGPESSASDGLAEPSAKRRRAEKMVESLMSLPDRKADLLFQLLRELRD